MSEEVPLDPVLACKADTHKHINRVRHYMWKAIDRLIKQAEEHDASKLESPEIQGFAASEVNLAKCRFPSPEYDASIENLKATLAHHYAHNRHHPEHWPNGVNDMTLLDLVEMICDWKAATERQLDGNIRKSVDYNAKKHKFSPQLQQIFENTVRELFEK